MSESPSVALGQEASVHGLTLWTRRLRVVLHRIGWQRLRQIIALVLAFIVLGIIALIEYKFSFGAI